jgi:uncharacterized membrane protein YfcA
MILFICLGLGVGVVSGLLGIGGGILLIPGLMWLTGIEDQRRAAGMTLAVLTLPVFLPSTWRYLADGRMELSDLVHVALVAIGVGAGAFLGASLIQYINLTILRVLFGLMLIFVAFRYLIGSDREVAAALFGLLAVACAWLAYIGLRILGRRNLPRPDLAAKIQAVHPHTPDPLDYSI